MKSLCFALFATVAGNMLGQACLAAELSPSRAVTLPDTIKAPEDISAIGAFGNFLIVGSDEGTGPGANENIVQVLSKTGDAAYRVDHDILLFSGNDEDGKEMDIEGIAVEDETLYVLGSHSAKRPRVKGGRKYKKNLKTFRDTKIVREKSRDRIYRIKLDGQGRAIEGKSEHTSLRRLIQDHPVLTTFSAIPSKENGVDMEGIAVRDGTLYLGFRGPVFRGGYAPVMTLDFDDPAGTHALLYVRLGGRGIRSIARVSDGFLIVAGPVGDGPASYGLYHWDGRNMVPGKDRSPETMGRAWLLGEIRPPEEDGTTGKAEGVAVLKEDADSYELIIVYDGIKEKTAEYFEVSKAR